MFQCFFFRFKANSDESAGPQATAVRCVCSHEEGNKLASKLDTNQLLSGSSHTGLLPMFVLIDEAHLGLTLSFFAELYNLQADVGLLTLVSVELHPSVCMGVCVRVGV